MTLHVFIGWSGQKSYLVAKKLMVWLEEVIPNIETWMSEELSPGTVAWFSDLNEKLRQADFAVLCVNPDNWNSLWMSYEPGVVVGKTNKEVKVCPYLIDPYSLRRNLPEPLKLFWATKCTEEDTFQLVEMIHKAANCPVSDKSAKQLKKVFDKKWKELEAIILEVAGSPPPPQSPEPAEYIDDFVKVSQWIEMHQDRVYGRFHDVIRKAIAAIRADTYDSEVIFELAASHIRKSKARFKNEDSLLVGNVCVFFETYYREDDLRAAMTEMESTLGIDNNPHKKSRKPPSLKELELIREGWETYMEIAVAKVFAQFHTILLSKLNNYLGSLPNRNKGGA